MKTIMFMAAALIATPVFAGDYALYSKNGSVIETQSTTQGIVDRGTLSPGIYDSGNCDPNTTSASLISLVNTSIAYAVFEPCNAETVVVAYNYGAEGFYERGRVTVPVVGPFDRQPYVSTMTTGPVQSFTLLVTDLDLVPQNSVLLYNNRFQLLEELSYNDAKITKAFIDNGGQLFYVCVKPGDGSLPALYVFQFQSKGNVLHTSQPVLPVPYTAVGTYTDRSILTQYCKPLSPAV